MEVDKLRMLETLSVLRRTGAISEGEFMDKANDLLDALYPAHARRRDGERTPGSLWLPLPALLLGLLSLGALLNLYSAPPAEVALLAILAITVAGISLATQRHGTGMALVGLITGAVSLLHLLTPLLP